jgi:hypothetical protein
VSIEFGKVRIQIVIALLILGVISVMAILSKQEEFIAIVTGCIGGVIALGMKLLEGE